VVEAVLHELDASSPVHSADASVECKHGCWNSSRMAVQELDVIDVRLISRALPGLDTTVVVTYASDKRVDRKNALACGNGGCSGRGTSKLPEG